MKIVITGATGFLGAHLVRHYAKLGHEVIAWGRKAAAPKPLLQLAQYYPADLRGDLPQLKADCCIHVAAKADDFGSYADFKAVNVLGTQKVFEAIDCLVFVQISSASIYPLLDHAISEDDVEPHHFLSAYGKSKWEAEQFLATQGIGNKSIGVLRPRAIYGTHDRVLLPRILNLVRRQSLVLPGDFSIAISMTHVQNLIHAIDLFLAQQPPGFSVYNVADQQSYELREVVEKMVFGAYEKPLPIKEIPLALIKAYIHLCHFFGKRPTVSSQAIDYVSQSTILNTQKIEDELGFRATANFDSELLHILQWVKKVGIENIRKPAHDLCWRHLDFAEKTTK